MHVIPYLLGVAGAIVACAILWSGIGLLVLRCLGRRAVAGWDLLIAPWLGWCAALGVLQLWHLRLPVDGRAFVPLLLLFAAGVGFGGRALWQSLREQGRLSAGWLLLAAAAAVWVACHTTAQPGHPDSAFYHLMAVRWAAEHPIVPGLGNLQGQLAFNNSHFLYAALLDTGPFTGRSHHLASGMLLFLALLRSLGALRDLLLRRDAPAPWRIYDALFFVPIVVYTMGVYGCSPSPDVGVFVLGVVAGSELLRMAASEGAAEGGATEPSINAASFLSLVFLCAAGVTVKLSFVAFGVTACAAALALWALRDGWRTATRPGVLGPAVLVAAAFLGPWMYRGVILSGYLAYPASIGGFPVDWRMPAEVVRLHADWVRSWARSPGLPPGEVLGDGRWLWLWLNRTLRSDFAVAVPLAMAFALAPWLLFAGERRNGHRRLDRAWLFMAVPLASLLFWFFTAPEPRFAGAAFWAAGLGATALACRGLSRSTVLAVAGCITLLLFSGSVDPFEFLRPWHMNARPAKQGVMEIRQTDSGLAVLVPKPGGACWNAPLPCTPHFNPRLRQRTPGMLRDGFALDPAPPAARP